jgi:hypothetical protein
MENTQHEFGEIRSPGSHLAAAAVLILISGAFMVWAGYAFAEGRIAYGLWITTPPGFTIEAAFLLVRQHDRATGHSAPSLGTRMGQEGIILLAGGVMVLAGFAAAGFELVVGSAAHPPRLTSHRDRGLARTTVRTYAAASSSARPAGNRPPARPKRSGSQRAPPTPKKGRASGLKASASPG